MIRQDNGELEPAVSNTSSPTLDNNPLISVSDTSASTPSSTSSASSSSSTGQRQDNDNNNNCTDYNKMLMETIYRDNLLSYQEKLRREYEEKYQKSIEMFKMNHEKEISLKLKQLDRSTKKRILDMAVLYKQRLEQFEKDQQMRVYHDDNHKQKQDELEQNAEENEKKIEQLQLEQQQLIDQFKVKIESNSVTLEEKQEKIDKLEQKQFENQQEISRLISKLDIVSNTISELLVSSDNVTSQNQVFQKFIESLETNVGK